MGRDIVSGDSNMINGGRYESNNQESVLVVEIRTFHDEFSNEKNHKFIRRSDEVFYVIDDGEIIMPEKNDKNLYMGTRKDIWTNDFQKRSFIQKLRGKKIPSIKVLGINPNPFSVTVPINVRLSTSESIPGTCTVDFLCDIRSEDSINTLSSLVQDDFADHIKGLEEIYRMTEKGMSMKLRGYIGDCSLDVLSDYDRTFDVTKKLRSALFDNLRTDVAFANKGLIVQRSLVRFDESISEKIMRMRTEGKVQIAEDQIKHERNMMVLEFTDEEYDAINR